MRRLTLTGRELEILDLVSKGFTYPEIGPRVFLAPETVRSHAKKAIVKMGARTQAQAVAVAIREGLLSGPDATSRYERRLEEIALDVSELAAQLAALRSEMTVA